MGFHLTEKIETVRQKLSRLLAASSELTLLLLSSCKRQEEAPYCWRLICLPMLCYHVLLRIAMSCQLPSRDLGQLSIPSLCCVLNLSFSLILSLLALLHSRTLQLYQYVLFLLVKRKKLELNIFRFVASGGRYMEVYYFHLYPLYQLFFLLQKSKKTVSSTMGLVKIRDYNCKIMSVRSDYRQLLFL